MTVPERLAFLLISDIHFGPSAISADFALKDAPPKHEISGATPMKTSLIEALSGKNISLLCPPVFEGQCGARRKAASNGSARIQWATIARSIEQYL